MSILIGRHIAEKAGGVLRGGLYPVVAKRGASATPYGVYGTEALEADSSKDGGVYDRVTVWVLVAGRTYSEAADGAQALRTALEHHGGDYTAFVVEDCELCGVQDGYDEAGELYTVGLKFLFTTINC